MKEYSYRQELIEYLLTLLLELVDFVKQHPEALPSLVSLWFEIQGAIARERCKQASTICPLGVLNCECRPDPFR